VSLQALARVGSRDGEATQLGVCAQGLSQADIDRRSRIDSVAGVASGVNAPSEQLRTKPELTDQSRTRWFRRSLYTIWCVYAVVDAA